MKKIIIVCLILMFCLSSFVIGNPVESENTKSSAQRVVLAQFFTNAGCDPCVGSTKAISRLADEYKTQLAVLEYHVNTTSYEDPFIIDDCEETWDYYAPCDKFWEVKGTPDMFFDGVIEEGGGDEEDRYDTFKADIEYELGIEAYYNICVTSEINGNIGKVVANIEKIKEPGVGNLKVKFVIFEDNISFEGHNGIKIQRFVVRNALPSSDLTSSVTKTFAIQNDWNQDELGVVVYVQSDDTQAVERTGTHYFYHHNIFQASICKFGVSLTSDENSKDVGSGGTATFDINMKNMMSATETYGISLEKTFPSGWDASYTACTGSMCYSNPSTITLSLNETAEIEIDVVSSADSQPNDSGSVMLTVVSHTNPYVKSSIFLKTTILSGPTQPTLTFKSASATSITISWSKNTDSNFNRYEIHMSTSYGFTPSNTTLVKTITNQNTVSWEVTGLTENTEYYFKLRVYDTNSQYSDSNEINAKTSKTETEGGRGGIPGFDAGMIIFALGIIFMFRKRFFR